MSEIIEKLTIKKKMSTNSLFSASHIHDLKFLFKRKSVRIFSHLLSLFLTLLPSILSWELEIRRVHSVETLDVPFGGLDFSAYFHLFTVLNV